MKFSHIKNLSTSLRTFSNPLKQQQFYSTNTVGVVGAGLMGRGIVQVTSQHAQKQVILYDVQEEQLQKAQGFIKKQLEKQVKREKMSAEQAEEIQARMQYTTEIGDLKECDMVIEAATENTELKLKIFNELADVVDEDCILASNTSSISITKIAGGVKKNPGRVIGLHYFNPVPMMKLVEIIRALQTTDQVYEDCEAFVVEQNKVGAEVKDSPGFAVNRILCVQINEAIQVLHEGIATVEDIDKTMKLGTNVPMGPLTLCDFVGIDTLLSVMQVFHREFGDSKYRPSPLLVKMVEAGYYGAKNGKGFYVYNKDGSKTPNPNLGC